jgi:hypothetical protein
MQSRHFLHVLFACHWLWHQVKLVEGKYQRSVPFRKPMAARRKIVAIVEEVAYLRRIVIVEKFLNTIPKILIQELAIATSRNKCSLALE